MVKSLLCLLDIHTPDIKEYGIYYTFDYYCSRCKYCNRTIFKKAGKQNWSKKL